MKSSTRQNIAKYRSFITCGIDEAGRGAWAGPLVAASVVLKPEDYTLFRHLSQKTRDSKTISEKTREYIYAHIQKHSLIMQTHIIHIRQINNRGIQFANIKAIRSLIYANRADIHIIDGTFTFPRLPITKNVVSIVDADATILPVILAGIVAKVTRDRIMNTLHNDFPLYDWIHNKGYGTKKHKDALETYGITKYHRGIFVSTALRKHR